MNKLKSKLGNFTRGIAIALLISIAISILVVSYAHTTDGESDEEQLNNDNDIIVITTPTPEPMMSSMPTAPMLPAIPPLPVAEEHAYDALGVSEDECDDECCNYDHHTYRDDFDADADADADPDAESFMGITATSGNAHLDPGTAAICSIMDGGCGRQLAHCICPGQGSGGGGSGGGGGSSQINCTVCGTRHAAPSCPPFGDFFVTIFFELNGGNRTGGGALQQTFGLGHHPVLPEVIREGHTFVGWAVDPPLWLGAPHLHFHTYTAQWSINSYTIRFEDWDGRYIASQSVTHGANATAPGNPTREGHTFSGWSHALNNVRDNLTIRATYVINQFNVRFEDWDGNHIVTRTVNWNTGATAPENPTREGHTFAGWNQAFNNVRNDLTVRATYVINQFNVRFEDWNGNHIVTRMVNWNTGATAPENPTREGHTFSGWSQLFNNVRNDLIVRATYVINQFNVRFEDWDGTHIMTRTVNWSTGATAPENPTREGHTFAGWNQAFSNVRNDLIVKATYVINQFDVRFEDWDGTHIVTRTVNWSTGALAPDNPVRYGYDFTEWNQSFSDVRNNLIIEAQYTPKQFDVVFVDWNDKELDRQKVDFNSSGKFPNFGDTNDEAAGFGAFTAISIIPSGPIRYGHTFIGWDTTDLTIRTESNLYVTALYTPNPYDVIFMDWDDEILKRQSVLFGTSAAAPNNPSKYGHTFSGWDRNDFIIMTESNLYVTAQYIPNRHDMIFLDYKEDEHARETLNFGTTARVPEDPSRYGYTFRRWDRDNLTLNQDNDIIIRPIFTPNLYDVVFLDFDNAEISRQAVEFGSSATAPNAPYHTWGIFTGWDIIDFTVSVADTLYVRALYEVKTFTVRFENWDGTEISASQVLWGMDATAPANPAREGHTFSGWDTAFNNVRSNLVVRAQFVRGENRDVVVQIPRNPTTITKPDTESVNDVDDIDDYLVVVTDTERLIKFITSVDENPEQSLPEYLLPLLDLPMIAAIQAQNAPSFTFFGRNVYFFAPFNMASWALVNLILTVLGIFFTTKTIISAIKNKRRQALAAQMSEDDDLNADALLLDDESDDFTSKEKSKWFIAGSIISILAAVLFAITQDLAAYTALLDVWTIVHMALVIAQIVVFKIYKKDDNVEDYSNTVETT